MGLVGLLVFLVVFVFQISVVGPSCFPVLSLLPIMYMLVKRFSEVA